MRIRFVHVLFEFILNIWVHGNFCMASRCCTISSQAISPSHFSRVFSHSYTPTHALPRFRCYTNVCYALFLRPRAISPRNTKTSLFGLPSFTTPVYRNTPELYLTGRPANLESRSHTSRCSLSYSALTLLSAHLFYDPGFLHSAFCFGHESYVFKSNIMGSEVPPGAHIHPPTHATRKQTPAPTHPFTHPYTHTQTQAYTHT